MGFPRQEHWGGLSLPPPGDLSNPGIRPASPALQVDSIPLSHLESIWKPYTASVYFQLFHWLNLKKPKAELAFPPQHSWEGPHRSPLFTAQTLGSGPWYFLHRLSHHSSSPPSPQELRITLWSTHYPCWATSNSNKWPLANLSRVWSYLIWPCIM